MLFQYKRLNKKLRILFGHAAENTSLELIVSFCLGEIQKGACQTEQKTEFVCNGLCLTVRGLVLVFLISVVLTVLQFMLRACSGWLAWDHRKNKVF